MNRPPVNLLLTLGLIGLAHTAGDTVAGRAEAVVCDVCHGADGNSPVPGFPKPAGQDERYLLKRMHDIKNGKRIVLEMIGLLTNLSDQDLVDTAAYFVSQKISVGTADPNLVAQGEALFHGGKIAEGVLACTGCHSPSGVDIVAVGFPHLGDQHATCAAKQLIDFREGIRTDDGDIKTVQSIAVKLSDRDIVTTSSYIQGLH